MLDERADKLGALDSLLRYDRLTKYVLPSGCLLKQIGILRVWIPDRSIYRKKSISKAWILQQK